MSKGGYNQGKPNKQRMQAWGAKGKSSPTLIKNKMFSDIFHKKMERKRDFVKYISS